MPKIIDITGQRFGRLVVIGLDRHGDGVAYFRCRCDCGVVKVIRSAALRYGHSRSCGCLSRATARSLLMKHGGAGTRLHRIWGGMKQRTGDQNAKDYPRYGGRGITICAEWQSFVAFRDWALANGYRDDLSLDRWPDNDGDYEPSNCRWATMTEQANNRRPPRRREVQIGPHR